MEEKGNVEGVVAPQIAGSAGSRQNLLVVLVADSRGLRITLGQAQSNIRTYHSMVSFTLIPLKV